MNAQVIKRWIFLGGALGITLVLVWKAPPKEHVASGQDKSSLVNAVQSRYLQQDNTLETSDTSFKLAKRVASADTQANLFAVQMTKQSIKNRGSRPAVVTPTAPPLPYVFVGKMTENGQAKGFIQVGETLLSVKEGEVLESQYEVISIGNDCVNVLYLPLNTAQSICENPGKSLPLATLAKGLPAEE